MWRVIPDFPLKEVEEYARSSQARGDLRSMELRYENAEKNISMSERSICPMSESAGDTSGMTLESLRKLGDSWQVSAFCAGISSTGKARVRAFEGEAQARQAREHLQGIRRQRLWALPGQLGLEEARRT